MKCKLYLSGRGYANKTYKGDKIAFETRIIFILGIIFKNNC